MATNAKQSSRVIGMEKKTPSTNSHNTIISTKRPTKSSTTITTSSTTKPTSTPSTKAIPNYLKPTISSIINASPNKPIPNQRRTLNKPLSSSNSTKLPNQPYSKLHNVIARTTKPLQSPSTQVKGTKLSKPISCKTSKTLTRDGKTKPSLVTKKVVNNGHASSISRNNKAKIIESEEVKEVEVVRKVENEEHKVEHDQDISHVESLHDHGELEEYEEKVISIVSEVEEAKKESGEEDSTNQNENNKNETHQEEYEVVVKDENNNEVEKGKEKEVSEKVEEVKDEEQVATRGNGKKEAKVSNDVIEETASKLLEERKNKVKALAGAFQSVIDYQAPTK